MLAVVWFNLRLTQWNLIFCGWKIGDAIDRLEEKKSKVDKSKVCVCLFDFFQAFFMGGCGCTTMFAAKARCQYKFSIEVYYVRETKKLVKNRLEKIINSIPVITWSRLTLSSTWGSTPWGFKRFPSATTVRQPPSRLNYFVENGIELPDR